MSSVTWKKTTQVFQTLGVPPSFGRIFWPMMGCTRNNRKALTKSVMA